MMILRDKQLIIFDADGTLRSAVSNKYSPNTIDDWELRPKVLLWFENNVGRYHYGIASNQGGVAIPSLPLTEHIAVGALRALAARLRIPSAAIRTAMTMDRGHHDRKPNPGMLLSIAEYYNTSVEDSVMVGDRAEDKEAANNANKMDFIWAKDFFGW